MNVWRYGRRLRLGLVAINRIDPHVYFAYRTNRAALDEFDDPPIVIPGVNPRSDLRHALVLTRGLRDNARFRDGARQRLLAIKMTSAPKRGDSRDGMRMIGRGYDDCINARLIDETAEVVVGLRLRETLRGRREIVVIDIAERDDVFADEIIDAELGLASRADETDVQFVVRGRASTQRPCVGKGGSGDGGLLDKSAARNGGVHGELDVFMELNAPLVGRGE